MAENVIEKYFGGVLEIDNITSPRVYISLPYSVSFFFWKSVLVV